jgi:drug/metabolite transporter (DMT)-like permease/ribosomal protein S18 acetylase RimI-like enzyme
MIKGRPASHRRAPRQFSINADDPNHLGDLLASSATRTVALRCPPMPRSRENLGLLLGFAGMLIFSGTVPAVRLAVAAINPWFLTFGRACLAGLIALAILVVLRRPVPPRGTFFDAAAAGLCVVYGFPLCTALALERVPAAHGGVVLSILPLATAATAAVLAHERPSPGFWLASAAGGALVAAFALRHGGGALVGGDLMLLAAIASSAVGYTLAGRLSFDMPGWEVICWILVMLLPVGLIGTIASWPADVGAIPAPAWTAFLYTVLFSQLLGFFAWNGGLALGGIARVSQMQLLQPFVIVGLAAVINHEAVEAETLAFAAAVVISVVIGRAMRVARGRMIIREARADDLAAIAAVAEAAYREFAQRLGEGDWPRLVKSLDPEAYREAGAMLLAAEVDGAVRGSVVYCAPGRSDPAVYPADWASIRALAVDPSARVAGMGRALTQACIDHARNDKAGVIGLHTSEAMVVARGLYERMGFVVVRELPPRFGLRYWLFRKDLT